MAESRSHAPKAPEALRKAMALREVIPFIGAGISAGARDDEFRGLPNYAKLTVDMAQKVERRKTESINVGDVEKMVNVGDFEEAHKMIRAASDSDMDWFKDLRSCILSVKPRPSPVHRFLSLMDFRAYITTNYDTLLEQFVTPTPEVLTGLDSQSMAAFMADDESPPFIFKVHGNISRKESIVVGKADPQGFTVQMESDLRSFLETLLNKTTIVFLGYSFSATEVESFFWRNCAGLKVNRKHYALVPDSIWKDGELAVEWRKLCDIPIEFITFKPDNDFSQVWEFVATMGPPAPVPDNKNTPYKSFYLARDRPTYLRLQLEFEKAAQIICFFTPSITNGLAPREYVEKRCGPSLAKFKDEFDFDEKDEITSFEDFTAKTLEMMLGRCDNLVQLLETQKAEVSCLCLASRVAKDLETDVGQKRFKWILSNLERWPTLRFYFLPKDLDTRDYMASSYAIVLGEQKGVAMFFASQATTNNFLTHMVLANTLEVNNEVFRFNYNVAHALSFRDSIQFVKDRLRPGPEPEPVPEEQKSNICSVS